MRSDVIGKRIALEKHIEGIGVENPIDVPTVLFQPGELEFEAQHMGDVAPVFGFAAIGNELDLQVLDEL
jgi:hypothetical protein